MHWPGTSLIAMLSVVMFFVFAIINSFNKKKIGHISVFGGWVIAAWFVYIFFKYLYWYAGPTILGFNSMFLGIFILTLIYLGTVLGGENKYLSKTVIVVSLIGTIISFIPSYTICYFFDLNEVINKENNPTNFHSWDKYSWFLYIRGKKEQALEANEKAINACLESGKIYNYDSSYELNVLNGHKFGIMTDTWTDSYIRY